MHEGRSAAPWLLLAPVLLIFGTALVFALGTIVFNSVTTYEPGVGQITDKLTLANYTAFLTDWYYWRLLGRTIWIALQTTVICLLLGYPTALYISRQTGQYRAILTAVILAPLFINLLVRVLGWYIVLGREGFVTKFLQLFMETPPQLLFTPTATLIGLVQVLLPLMVITLFSALVHIDRRLVQAARDLGASDVTVFWKVVLPLTVPSMAAGSVLIFVLAIGNFAVPTLLGGQRAPVMAYTAYENQVLVLNWPLGATITVILMIAVAVVITVYQLWLRQSRWGALMRGQ